MSSTATTVAWVKSSHAIRGQDPLGVRAPSEYVYNKLVPGVTTATDRARYFSFYPWLIWAINQRPDKLKKIPLHEKVRRADCLFTMIGVYHHSTLKDDLLHGALIGSQKLTPAVNEMKRTGQPIKISTFATTEPSAKKYFLNKLGGLGQYYIYPLREAGFIDGSLREGLGFTNERGEVIAKAFDEGVNGDDFFELLESDVVTEDALENLVEFCSCNIVDNSSEQQALIDFFFNREGIFYEESSHSRTATFKLLLDLLQKLKASDFSILPHWSGVRIFLACAYSNALPERISWEVNNEFLSENRMGWQQYLANDLISYALQSLFWAGLEVLFLDETYLPNSSTYAQWFADKFIPHLHIDGKLSFADAINVTQKSLPAIEDWQNEAHEIQLAWRITEILNDRTVLDKYEPVASTAVKLLLALVARWEEFGEPEHLFSIVPPPKFLEAYPINLFSFIRYAGAGWREMNLSDWLKWLTAKWNIEIHLRVALRKLNHESADTFKIIPSDEGLQVIDSVQPTFTSPRLRPSLQILLDIGALKFNESKQGLEITMLGTKILEEEQSVG
jgi:hypothetical protein